MQKLPDTELEIMQVIWQENRVLSTSEIKEKLDLSRPWNCLLYTSPSPRDS